MLKCLGICGNDQWPWSIDRIDRVFNSEACSNACFRRGLKEKGKIVLDGVRKKGWYVLHVGFFFVLSFVFWLLSHGSSCLFLVSEVNAMSCVCLPVSFILTLHCCWSSVTFNFIWVTVYLNISLKAKFQTSVVSCFTKKKPLLKTSYTQSLWKQYFTLDPSVWPECWTGKWVKRQEFQKGFLYMLLLCLRHFILRKGYSINSLWIFTGSLHRKLLRKNHVNTNNIWGWFQRHNI